MNAKTRFQLSIGGLTVLLIAGLSGTFIMGIFLYMDGLEVIKLAWALISLAVGVTSLWFIIHLNKKEVAARTDAVVNDYHEFIDKWNIPEVEWGEFVKKRLAYDTKESNSWGYTIAGVLIFLVAFIGFSSMSEDDLYIVIPSTLVIGFFMGKWGSMLFAQKRYKKDKVIKNGEIHFAEKLVVLNGKLIVLDDFGIRLRSFQQQTLSDMPILAFSVESGLGNRKSSRTYMIPIPKTKNEFVKELIDHYAKLVV